MSAVVALLAACQQTDTYPEAAAIAAFSLPAALAFAAYMKWHR